MIKDIYVINLISEIDRFNKIKNNLSDTEFNVIRVDALVGVQLPDVACVLMTRNEWSPHHKGTLGCFLSHVRTWEQISKSEYPALIIEDDSSFVGLDRLGELTIPNDLDIIFVNERTAYPGPHGLRSVSPILAFVAAHGRATGTDGYIITPEGARKCLEYIRADSLFTHVDLRLIAYCVSLEDAEHEAQKNPSNMFLNTVKDLKNSYPVDHKLRGASLFPAIVDHLQIYSRRDHYDKVGKS